MKKTAYNLLSAAIIAQLLGGPVYAQNWKPETFHFEYNAGPMSAGPASEEIIDLYAAQPENRYISDELSPTQKFRYTFGAMMLRTNFFPNTVKIFAIGQDAVDDAELVKLPGTGTGYSTRVQNIANHHGVDQSLATSNASFQTIKGQYGSFDHPYVELNEDGEPEIQQSKLIDNYLWTIFNGKNSPIVAHREKAWDWEIKNNLKSLRLIILFGGASQDAFSEYLIHRGFRVPTRTPKERLARIQIPESKLVYAGGNNEFAVLQTKDGKDLYAELLGRTLDYKSPKDQQAAIAALDKYSEKAIKLMAFTGGGVEGSGLVNAAQLGGYDLAKAEKLVNGKWVKTHSLKGLKLADGTVIETDIAFAGSPHPTALSTDTAEASKTITRIFEGVQDLIGGKNAIESDVDAKGKPRINHFAKGDDFTYGRAYLPRRVVPFGAPDSILRPHSSADRLGPQVLVSEPPSRDELKEAGIFDLDDIFDAELIEAAKNAQPVEPLDEKDIWSQHSRQKSTRALSDWGPGPVMAKLMVENLDPKVLDNVSAPGLGYFAHFRGTFKNPSALIVYDPIDLEDRNTFRAATGARGQALNGLMRDLGVEKEQLVIASIPADMTDATAADWETVRKGTEDYREAVLKEILATSELEVIFTDGPISQKETARILKQLKKDSIPVIDIARGDDALSGIVDAGKEAKKLPAFKSAKITGKMAGIPHEQLPWNSRDWERVTHGTVIEAKGKFKGKSYAVVTPNFVAEQKLKPLPETLKAIESSKAELAKLNIRPANESIPAFLKRTGQSGSFSPAAAKK